MYKIKNYQELIDHGNKELRQTVLEVADRTLNEIDSYHGLKEMINVTANGKLIIGKKEWSLNSYDEIFLIAAGKAANAMTKAISEKLENYLTRGIAIVKVKEESDVYKKVAVFVGGHPLPNETGKNATEKILKMVEKSSKNALFLTAMSGGSSALMSLPMEGISLDDESKTTDILLKSGAGIYEINAVRRHISQVNGGKLAQKIQEKGAELIGFGISDAVGNMPTLNNNEPYKNYNSTPIGPDKTTLDDARGTIKKYKLESSLPESVINFFKNADEKLETPKKFPNNTYYVINTVPDLALAAKKSAESLGISATIVTSFLEGDSKEAATFFCSLAKEIEYLNKPLKRPAILIFAGETTTKIENSNNIRGHGGPSLELTAKFAMISSKLEHTCLLSIDTEGTDGTTYCAGGIVDSFSLGAALDSNVDLEKSLQYHSTLEALDKIHSAIYTGNTGTNLCDLNILYIA